MTADVGVVLEERYAVSLGEQPGTRKTSDAAADHGDSLRHVRWDPSEAIPGGQQNLDRSAFNQQPHGAKNILGGRRLARIVRPAPEIGARIV
jgi:hypothetical protein